MCTCVHLAHTIVLVNIYKLSHAFSQQIFRARSCWRCVNYVFDMYSEAGGIGGYLSIIYICICSRTMLSRMVATSYIRLFSI